MTDLELQLLPERRKRIEVSIPGQNRSLILSLLLLVVVGVLYAGLYFYKTSLVSSAQSIDNDLAVLEQKRDKSTEQKLLSLNQKLAIAKPILSSHLFWSAAFARLQNLTEPQVQFNSLNAGLNDKKINFKAEAANYTVVARQIASFLSEKSVSNITLDKVTSLPTGRVEFTMTMTFDPTLFLTKPK